MQLKNFLLKNESLLFKYIHHALQNWKTCKTWDFLSGDWILTLKILFFTGIVVKNTDSEAGQSGFDPSALTSLYLDFFVFKMRHTIAPLRVYKH